MKRLGLVLLAAAGLAAWWINSPPAGAGRQVFAVPQGGTARAVARRLEEAGQVRSGRWFLLLARATGSTGRIKAGAYALRGGQSASALLRELVSGRTQLARVTVPEGFTTWQIAERMAAEKVCPADEFLAAAAGAEGFLFPDTYFFEPGTAAAQAAALMRENFERNWNRVLERAVTAGAVTEVRESPGPAADPVLRLADGRLWKKSQIVTLASIVEREAQKPEERARISAVFHNRLKKGMRLESDPTVQYSLGYWKERILFKDLDHPGPYNTYRRFGLPPGPICSPGAAALSAALAPAPARDLYFVADEQGGHRFFETYRDHLQGVRERDQNRRLKKKLRR
ncbi:MAG: endolytic transglycosylase MltG [Elusimicrobiota bacterium]